MIDPTDVNDLQLEDVEDYKNDYPADAFPQTENLHHTGDDDSNPSYRRSKLMALLHTNKWFAGMIGVLVVVMIVVFSIVMSGLKNSGDEKAVSGGSDSAADGGGAGSGSGSGGSSSGGGTGVDHPEVIVVDPEDVDEEVAESLITTLRNVYLRHGLDDSVLDENDVPTPQKLAFYWLATDAESADHSHTQLIQRYALACFYYSTNGRPNIYETNPLPWVDANLWLGKAHECEWKGVICNDAEKVESIDLERNHLAGSLPMELAMISDTLLSLDLTSNLIYMEAELYDVFEKLTNLETLLIDDNFLATEHGLPHTFKALTNLEKLRMSYNLLSGPLENYNSPDRSVLSHLTKLSHLEIESNFLTGTMPQAVSTLENLVYLYIRRNEMEFNLDFLKSGQLSSLFALWLDSNKVTGTIPTELGLATDLASLSITNSTLNGEIPTEIGNLKGLRRLWLYTNQLTGKIPSELGTLDRLEVVELHGNLLTGVMPQGVCEDIAASTYQYKALTSDCNRNNLSCSLDDCCTACYD